MKRLAAIFVLLIALALQASAQWYLFPGKKKKNQEERKTESPAQQKEQNQQTYVPLVEQETPRDTVSGEAVSGDDFVLDIPGTIHVTLLLPLKSLSSKPSGNFYEFYTGALLAADDLGRSGYNISLNIFDTDNAGLQVPQSVLDDSDVIIGPVSSGNIRNMLQRCGDDKYIISPLEPKAGELSDSSRVIQLPVPWQDQTDDQVRWIAESYKPSDELVIIADDNPSRVGESINYLVRKIEESGIEHSTIHSTKVDDIQLSPHNTFFVIASEDENYLCTAANNVGSLAGKSEGVVLFGNSKLRTFDSVHSESLFKANARLTSNYYVDYSDLKVREFVMRFRAVYNAEPSSFAFHGYDTMHYFVTICGTYGRQWYKKISEYSEKGLQTDFKFDSSGKAGAVNTAVRRIRFNPDLTSTLQ